MGYCTHQPSFDSRDAICVVCTTGAPRGILHPSGNPSGGSMLSKTFEKAGRNRQRNAIAIELSNEDKILTT